jgi:hypothetical protein
MSLRPAGSGIETASHFRNRLRLAYHHGGARVTEQVDVAALKAAAFGRAGSIPVPRTTGFGLQYEPLRVR